jgi:hypothetical protein
MLKKNIFYSILYTYLGKAERIKRLTKYCFFGVHFAMLTMQRLHDK